MSVDDRTVARFGDEWSRFDQSTRSEADLRGTFDRYFAVFPWAEVGEEAIGADIGCGSGRWAQFVAPRVGRLYAVDPSPQALDVARRILKQHQNTVVIEGAAGSLPDELEQLDFAYSLGVLHHTPDPASALGDVVSRLRPGAPLLLYLYYAMDDRPAWFRVIWRLSDAVRRQISRLPVASRRYITNIVALLVYWPLSRTARVGDRLGLSVSSWPLSAYRGKPLYVLRTDALDRLGTPVEHRYTRDEMAELMENSGLKRIRFSPDEPFWCAVGYRC